MQGTQFITAGFGPNRRIFRRRVRARRRRVIGDEKLQIEPLERRRREVPQ